MNAADTLAKLISLLSSVLPVITQFNTELAQIKANDPAVWDALVAHNTVATDAWHASVAAHPGA